MRIQKSYQKTKLDGELCLGTQTQESDLDGGTRKLLGGAYQEVLKHGEQGVRQTGEGGDKRKECVSATAGPCQDANASEGPQGT